MKLPGNIPLVTTISERCRVCYTCVRECPAKAIRIADGQAEVIPERCIGCGNCVLICNQLAKNVLDGTSEVRGLLSGPHPVAAIVAPSFPAEFTDMPYRGLVGMIRALGFHSVHEVAFGADVVAKAYRELLEADRRKRYIATSCPAVVGFVERYTPALVPALAPIVSPMIAMARIVRALNGDDWKTVFIGPCIAKKGEAAAEAVQGDVDAALTFAELRSMFEHAGLKHEDAGEVDFDPPHAGHGALFPVSRGMLQAAQIEENLIDGDVVATDGRTNFDEAMKEFESGDLDARLLEVLCCNGCIMGAGMTTTAAKFSRRNRISRYVREQCAERDEAAWQDAMAACASVNLHRTYQANDQRIPPPSEEEMADIMARMGKHSIEDELNCGACGYITCREHAVAIHKGLAENEMCLPYTIDELRRTISELDVSNSDLATAQEALMHSERLASMGQLAAGVAHEVNNPLGVVLMYAHLLLEEESPGNPQLREDLSMIVEQADRCKKIVSRLLDFARQNKVILQPTNIEGLCERCTKTVKTRDGISVTLERGCSDPVAELDSDQITQVLTNLVSNAMDAMPDGGSIRLETEDNADTVMVRVVDTGIGIAPDNIGKIFEPFFTLKQIGKGTGLGLAVTYGIVKMHRGNIDVHSNNDPAVGATGTTFTVTLPRHGTDTA